MDVNDIHFEPKQPATAPRLVGSESRNFVSIHSNFEPKQPAIAPRLVGSESRNFVSTMRKCHLHSSTFDIRLK